MAAYFDADGDRFSLTTGLFSYNSAYTLMAWIQPKALNGLIQYQFIINRDAATQWHNMDNIVINASNQWDMGQLVAASPSQAPATTTPVIDTWHHLCMRRNSTTSLELFVNGAKEGSTLTASVAGRSANTLFRLGMPGSWAATAGARSVMAHVKCWTAALTDAEIADEMRRGAPRRFTNLWGWWPAFSGASEMVRDYSGNGRGWTAAGSVTDADGPPVTWGGRTWFMARAAAAAPKSFIYKRPAAQMAIRRRTW
jgi:hypothetical protein